MRLVMFGTGPFAVPIFKSLLESRHDVAALFTRPIADSGKRRKTAENPTRDVGEAAGIPIFDPQDVNSDASIAQLKGLNADLFVVCDYGQIMSRECLSAARLGGINLHGSLLPKYRGAAPINWAIYNGETKTGVTVIHMSPRLDAGPALAEAELVIGPTQTTEQLEPLLAELGVEPVHQAIEQLSSWDGESNIGEIQDRKLATKAPRLKKSDGLIDYQRTAQQIVNQIRAFQPWPGTFTHWENSGKNPLRIIVHQAEAVEVSGTHSVGTVCESTSDKLVIQTGDGGLSLKVIQPAGKKPMEIESFLRGQKPELGDQYN